MKTHLRSLGLRAHRVAGGCGSGLLLLGLLSPTNDPHASALKLALPFLLAAAALAPLAIWRRRLAPAWVLLHLSLMLLGSLSALAWFRLQLPGADLAALMLLLCGIAAGGVAGRRAMPAQRR